MKNLPTRRTVLRWTAVGAVMAGIVTALGWRRLAVRLAERAAARVRASARPVPPDVFERIRARTRPLDPASIRPSPPTLVG